jgi:penicillin-binding protein 2
MRIVEKIRRSLKHMQRLIHHNLLSVDAAERSPLRRGYRLIYYTLRGVNVHRTMVDRKWYDNIVRGMRQAVTGGTCRGANSALYEVCGKTGTAQNRGRDHSAFMGFAPMNDPKIAIAVYVENGGFGATYGVPIGALMMEQYLKGSLSESSKIKATEMQNRVIFYGEAER